MAEEIRILRCDMCRTLEEIPDYQGDPKYDHVLEALIQRKHTEPSGQTHIGQLMKVEKQHWESPSTRREILRQLKAKAGGGSTGFEPEFYNQRDTFREDAMACWKKHFRNPDCNEYDAEKMRLIPDTSAERKEAGMGKYELAAGDYVTLCRFCPVHTKVMEDRRWKAGLYK
jgi:hypothetical protein